jgi:hypothetical protein
MTVFGWDCSHYDGLLSKTILSRAKSEGIDFFVHKVAEGLQDTEGFNDDTALSAARDAGIEFIGAYFIPRTLDTADQITYWIKQINSGEPWLKGWPGRFVVVDLERWSYDNVSASKGIDCANRIRDALGWTTFLYASHSQYGSSVVDWDGPLWNADYVPRSPGQFKSMYPGDLWFPSHGSWFGGWSPYAGKTPTILQYTSSATIAGLTTCDANAFRGSINGLRNMIGGHDMEQTDAVTGYGSRGNSVGDVLADQSNLRDQWYLAATQNSKNPPLAGSRFDLLMQAVSRVLAWPNPGVAELSDVQLALIVQKVSELISPAIANLLAANTEFSSVIAESVVSKIVSRLQS